MMKHYSIVVAIMLLFNFNIFSQTAPPWDFNGTDENFVASNYSQLAVGDTYATYTIGGESPNPNLRNEDAQIDTSVGNFVAITMQNLTSNTRLQVITTVSGSNSFTNFDGITPNDSDFVTHYINMSSNANWNGTLGTINFRFKEAAGVNNVLSGDVLIDHIEILAAIPATPRVDYTFDDTSDSEGFIGANGVSLSQPVAGELRLDIAEQSPYPKLEQSGLYSVDADTYKYVQVTLINNPSTKNKLTFVSPSGGNEFSTSDMITNNPDPQTIEIDLSALTNWSGTQSNWWFQLVDNPGDGPVASAADIHIQQILFTTESSQPSSYDITFSVNMSNYPGGLGDGNVFLNGNFNGWCGECTPMSDDDGDGIWTVTVPLEDGDYEYKFTVNGWSSQEEFGSIGAVEGCTVTDGTYTNRSLSVAGSDMTLETVFWNLCPGETPGEVYNVTFAVDTANITVGASGMFLGGGAFGDAQGNAMSDDDGDGVYEVTLELSTDQIGANYIFLNGPGDGGDWGAKEDLAGQECADPNNYNDRILPEFDGDTYLLHCFGDCSGDGVGCSAAPLEGSWCEDFDGESFPAEGWVTFRGENGLGEGYDWEASSTYSVSGANSAHVRYENVTGGLAEDWLVTPMFIPDASNNHISFSHRQAYTTNYGSTYSVKVSTASQTTHADFVDLATWTEDDFEPGEFTSIEFSLDNYIGVPIHVAFVMTNDDGDDWYIDDVCVQAGLSTTDNEILDMMVYPNPVDGNYVTILSSVEGLKEIQVFTVTGRKVMDTTINGNTLDVSSFNSGFYMLKVTINGQSKVSKLVIR